MMMMMMMVVVVVMMMCKRLAQVPMLCVPIYNMKLAMMQKTPFFTTFSAHTKMAADKRGQNEAFARNVFFCDKKLNVKFAFLGSCTSLLPRSHPVHGGLQGACKTANHHATAWQKRSPTGSGQCLTMPNVTFCTDKKLASNWPVLGSCASIFLNRQATLRIGFPSSWFLRFFLAQALAFFLAQVPASNFAVLASAPVFLAAPLTRSPCHRLWSADIHTWKSR